MHLSQGLPLPVGKLNFKLELKKKKKNINIDLAVFAKL